MRNARGAGRILLFAVLVAMGCAPKGTPEPAPGLARLWRDYQAMADERALALAGDPDRVWVAAASGGHPSPREAEESALLECFRRRAARRFQAPCRVYARGDEIVWEKR